MSRICLYYRVEPERNRWLPGDRFIRPAIRRLVRGPLRAGGVEKVFTNLCLGLDRLGIAYEVNLPFRELKEDDRVGVLGRGRHSLQGYDRPNPVVAGIGLMTHPSEWPTLCDEYPVVMYLQHSDWVNNIYKRYFGNSCRTWPVGIDTQAWRPANVEDKDIDFLIYDKIHWNRDEVIPGLLDPIRRELRRRQLSFIELRYGTYNEQQYKNALRHCRAMVYLSEHESQGLAYLECLASATPILAWNQGRYLDPNRFALGEQEIRATSVPFFDFRCGMTFQSIEVFPERLTQFLDSERGNLFAPREYISEHLTLEKCSRNFVDLLGIAAANHGFPK